MPQKAGFGCLELCLKRAGNSNTVILHLNLGAVQCSSLTTTVTTVTAPRLHRENCGQVLLVVVVVVVYSGLDLDDVERLTFFMILFI